MISDTSQNLQTTSKNCPKTSSKSKSFQKSPRKRPETLKPRKPNPNHPRHSQKLPRQSKQLQQKVSNKIQKLQTTQQKTKKEVSWPCSSAQGLNISLGSRAAKLGSGFVASISAAPTWQVALRRAAQVRKDEVRRVRMGGFCERGVFLDL